MSNHNAKNYTAMLGIDLAKTSFQRHSVDRLGAIVHKKKLTRKSLCEFIDQLPDMHDCNRNNGLDHI